MTISGIIISLLSQYYVPLITYTGANRAKGPESALISESDLLEKASQSSLYSRAHFSPLNSSLAGISDRESEESFTPERNKLNLAYFYAEDADDSDVLNSFAGEIYRELMTEDSRYIADLFDLSDTSPVNMARQLGSSSAKLLGKYNPDASGQDRNNPSTWYVPSFKRVNLSFYNSDGQAIKEYSNVKEIMAMASVYCYSQGSLDEEMFFRICRGLYKNAHSHKISIGNVYYDSGCINLSAKEEGEEEEKEEREAEEKKALLNADENSGDNGSNGEISKLPVTETAGTEGVVSQDNSLPSETGYAEYSSGEYYNPDNPNNYIAATASQIAGAPETSASVILPGSVGAGINGFGIGVNESGAGANGLNETAAGIQSNGATGWGEGNNAGNGAASINNISPQTEGMQTEGLNETSQLGSITGSSFSQSNNLETNIENGSETNPEIYPVADSNYYPDAGQDLYPDAGIVESSSAESYYDSEGGNLETAGDAVTIQQSGSLSDTFNEAVETNDSGISSQDTGFETEPDSENVSSGDFEPGNISGNGNLENSDSGNESLESVENLSSENLENEDNNNNSLETSDSEDNDLENTETSDSENESSETSEDKENDNKKNACPGHVDLYVSVTLSGFDDKKGLRSVDLDKLAWEGEKPAKPWEGWTEENIQAVHSLASQDWFKTYGLSISSLDPKTPLSKEEISSYLDKLPNSISSDRKKVVSYALSSVGKIPYYWGGKALNPGYEGNLFGTVTNADYRGRILRGLDCSGWIQWVYWSALGNNLDNAGSTSTLVGMGEKIHRADLKAGDIIIRTGDEGHVVMFLEWAGNGNMIAIHENASNNNVSVNEMTANYPYYRSLIR